MEKKKKLFLIILVIPVIFAKLWGNKVMILRIWSGRSWLMVNQPSHVLSASISLSFWWVNHSSFWHSSRMGFPRAPVTAKIKLFCCKLRHCQPTARISSTCLLLQTMAGVKKPNDYKLHCCPEQQAAFCQEKNNSISFGSRWKFAHKYL